MTIDSSGFDSGALGRDPVGDSSAGDDVPPGTTRRVLDSARRRTILRCLVRSDGPLPVRQLVARIADAEHDATAVTSLHDLRQRIHISLCRTHLPLLEDHRVVSYDRTDGLVAPGARLPAFESILAGHSSGNGDGSE